MTFSSPLLSQEQAPAPRFRGDNPCLRKDKASQEQTSVSTGAGIGEGAHMGESIKEGQVFLIDHRL